MTSVASYAREYFSYSRTPASRNSFHTFADVIGMSMCLHAEMPERIDHRIDDRGRRADSRRLTNTFRAERMMRRRRARSCQFPSSASPPPSAAGNS